MSWYFISPMKTVNSKRQGMKQKHVIHQALSEKKNKTKNPQRNKGIWELKIISETD